MSLHEGSPSWFEERMLKAVFVSLQHISEVFLQTIVIEMASHCSIKI